MKKLANKFVLTWGLFCVSYALLAVVCLKARDPWSLSSSVWLPAGITLIALCHSPRQHWPVWILTSALLHTLISVLYERPLGVTLLFTGADVVIFPLIALIWQRLAATGFSRSLFKMNLYCCVTVVIVSLLGGFILSLFFHAMHYPVEWMRSVTWGISASAGALATASFFLFDGGNAAYYFSHLNKISLQKSLLLITAFIMGSVFLLPVRMLEVNLTYCMSTLFIVWLMTTIITLSCSTLIVGIYFLFISIVISLGSLYGLGPLSTSVISEQGLFVSQLFLLIMSITSSLIYARVKEYRNRSEHSETLIELISAETPLSHFFLFRYYPMTEKIHWQGGMIKNPNLSTFLSTPSLLLGRVHEEDRPMISLFFSQRSQLSKIKSSVQFQIRFMDEELQYRHASLVFLSPEFRGKNLRLAGTIIFH